MTKELIVYEPILAEWQPIETAPKDRTRILLYLPDAPGGFDYTVGFWSEWRQAWYAVSGSGSGICDSQPTHWMGLPPPPRLTGTE